MSTVFFMSHALPLRSYGERQPPNHALHPVGPAAARRDQRVNFIR
jgi:hypothetical protein